MNFKKWLKENMTSTSCIATYALPLAFKIPKNKLIKSGKKAKLK